MGPIVVSRLQGDNVQKKEGGAHPVFYPSIPPYTQLEGLIFYAADIHHLIHFD